MLLSSLRNKNINFTAGKTVLYTDFDGTLLPESLYSAYNKNDKQKKVAIRSLNRYFSEIRNFADNKKNSLEIVITTGRTLNKDNDEGFNTTYKKFIKDNVNLPRFKEIITSDGGEAFSFMQDGKINPKAKQSKINLIKKLTGWDFNLVTEALDKASQKLQVSYEFIIKRGIYKFLLQISDKTKNKEFCDEFKKIINNSMQYGINICDFDYNKYSIKQGIQLYAMFNGHKIDKSFDIKLALKKAIKNDDLIIVAGNDSNDKEMLNLFNYIQNTSLKSVPKRAEDITLEYLKNIKSEIEALPIKILFIKPSKTENNQSKLSLYEFIKKQAKFFPDKVMIIDETKLYGKNKLLPAIKKIITNYAKENPAFQKVL